MTNATRTWIKVVADRLRSPALRGRWLMWALACLLGGALPASAVAQKVILLPPADRADQAASAANAAARDALGMQGLRVVTWDEAKAQLPKTERCDDVGACTTRAMAAAGAELAAGVVVVRDTQRVAERVTVALLDADNHRYDGEAAVENGDVRGATTRALLEARSFQLLGPGPWLKVEGTPEGAEVLLDGRLVGHLPYRASITPGSHELRVRDAGYAAFDQKLEIPGADGHRAEITVALEPAPIAANEGAAELRAIDAADTAPAERDHTWIVWPSLLGGAGVILAGVTTVRLATGLESCVRPDEAGRCVERREVNWVPTVLAYSVGAALIGTSVAWFVLESQAGDEPALTAQVGLGSVGLAGRF